MPVSTNNTRKPVAKFDRLGLKENPHQAQDDVENIAFQLLQMKGLLASAFQLDGFCRGATTNGVETLVLEYVVQEHRYQSFEEHQA